MDHIDNKILSILHENARITISEMSRLIVMSQPAVTERLRKLEEQGVITGYRAVLAPSKLGKYTTAFVLFKSNNCGSSRHTQSRLRRSSISGRVGSTIIY